MPATGKATVIGSPAVRLRNVRVPKLRDEIPTRHAELLPALKSFVTALNNSAILLYAKNLPVWQK